MILFHSKDDISVLWVSQPARSARVGRKSDSAHELNRIMRLPVNGRTGHVVAPLQPPPPVVTSAAPTNPIVLIPARLAATRLPNKPLAEIAGVPMIVHVWRRASAAKLGPVVVACGDREIAEVVERAGGRTVLTDPDLPTGSDRIHAAISEVDPDRR